ncbi:MAG: DUF3450 family protein [Proteobacteria bacterium]|nr:DUF3450 family protein [Pseudomonadota bacterium]
MTLISASGIRLASAEIVSADGGNNYLNLSEKLVTLRGQVSDLSSELQQLREEHKLEMRGLITQKNTVSANIKQEEISLDQQKEDLLENKKLIREIGADEETIKSALLIETEKLKLYVEHGLPFKAVGRLRSIDSYRRNLEAGVITSHKAVNTLWSMIEDELKLARDNGVYRQSVSIKNKEHLAHVAKLGMMMMYFRVSGGQGTDQYGRFRGRGNKWIAEISKDDKESGQIKSLFASLEKQIHIGYFELPNTLRVRSE